MRIFVLFVGGLLVGHGLGALGLKLYPWPYAVIVLMVGALLFYLGRCQNCAKPR